MTKNTSLKEFVVRHIAKGGAAYAVDMNTGENVFINSSLSERYSLDVGDEIKALVEPNTKEDAGVEWYALMIQVYDDE